MPGAETRLVQPQGQGLADDLSLREKVLNYFRGNTAIGQAVAPTIERNPQAQVMQQIQAAAAVQQGKAPIPPVNMPAPQAVNPYSIEYMIQEARNNRPRYDQQGNRIK